MSETHVERIAIKHRCEHIQQRDITLTLELAQRFWRKQYCDECLKKSYESSSHSDQNRRHHD
jgi:hypothetical protein